MSIVLTIALGIAASMVVHRMVDLECEDLAETEWSCDGE